MVDPTLSGAERIETEKDLGTGDQAKYAFWEAQEKIAEREERTWVKKAREIVKRYRDERPQAGQTISRFNILWSNVQTLKPTLYARTPKPDVQRRFLDQDPNGRLAATLLERCLSYSVDAFDFDSVMSAAVEDRLLPGRGVARVLYVPHFGEKIGDPEEQGETPEKEADEAVTGEQDYSNREETNAEYEDAEDAPSTVDNPGDNAKGDELREVVFEEVRAKYVFWEDYREGPARQWDEVPWIRYRSYMTRDELIARFGKKRGTQVELDYTPRGGTELSKDDKPPDIYKKAVIHEVWSKSDKKVIWYAPGTPDVILDEQDDPLRLQDFFANPDPLLATTTTDKRIPVPDYIEYQDQARELDTLTARIDRLTRALKVSGVYPGEEKQVLQQLIDEGTENRLIPVHDAAAWTDKGGLANMIQWMPIQQVAETLIQLYNARDRVKATLYEITGIGDIMRGATNPNETLGAQELKANFATRRIAPQQKDVARLARDLMRLMGNVIAEHFSAKTIGMISGYPQLDPVPQLPPKPQPPQMLPPPAPAPVAPQVTQPALDGGAAAAPTGPDGQPAQPVAPPPDPAVVAYNQALQQWQQMAQAVQAIQQKNAQKQAQFEAAVELIRRDGAHGFRIDIEADSTIAPDEQAEKQSRVEFLQQMVPLLEQVVPIAMGNPAMAALAREITLFAARGFRVARSLEETFEQAFDAIAQMPKAPQYAGDRQQGPSQQELAQKSKDTDAKVEVARINAGTKMAQIAADTQIEAKRLASEDFRSSQEHALNEQRVADTRAFREVRRNAIEGRTAEGLQ